MTDSDDSYESIDDTESSEESEGFMEYTLDIDDFTSHLKLTNDEKHFLRSATNGLTIAEIRDKFFK